MTGFYLNSDNSEGVPLVQGDNFLNQVYVCKIQVVSIDIGRCGVSADETTLNPNNNL